MRSIKVAWAVVFCTLATFIFSGQASFAADAKAATNPRAVIQATVMELNQQLGQLKQGQALAGESLEQIINSSLLPKADLGFMLKQILGPEWRGITPKKQQELLVAFKARLVTTYSAILKNYNNQRIKVFPLRGGLAANTNKRDGMDTVNIKTMIFGGGQPLDVTFSMVKTTNGWKVFDVIASGVSVVQSFSSQFRPFVKQNGVDSLIEALKKPVSRS
ncbi:putative phospholipid-binding protein MlaC precursor [Piscirickettsia salmonis]|uniref:Toluene tolerance Ttg2/phospholipid-binding protein MlaC n=1 Tax=Piscirickettsia salmonis TaxID=1238 RepID=A0A1L6TDT8_PISSA|nr:ABC transporter substrate-binding protein [Piscirickettsia salmonis]AKP74592.2 toluene tolerance protein [Piscirickettsia salmonis LF-89 = ATCC VR-1361]ALB23594.1 Toluene tolerance Ttg2/phospholipid-binding protein MlaC [Piscirickettsia salmonis]ALY03460.1 toluene tolerance protein [Piscirickettsia salmonis]AMA43025.1 toluene tolerance protein [Piscirickettsia salmonis]AOS35494.1 toluene tolerance protein [Piscirickettsia salmonis]